jgi:PAS domain-containing protein
VAFEAIKSGPKGSAGAPAKPQGIATSGALGLTSLLDSLDDLSDTLSRRAYEMFAEAMPDTRQWTEGQVQTFIEQAKGRFGAVLAVVEQGAQVDEALAQDLEAVGTEAARAGSSLPHLLLVLRISRDLLIDSAIRMTVGNEKLLQEFQARLLPAIDRLSDAIATGFWSGTTDEIESRYDQVATLIDGMSYGVYEADLDGVVVFANAALADVVDRRGAQLVGGQLVDIFKPAGGGASVSSLFNDSSTTHNVQLRVMTDTRRVVELDVHTVVRRDVEGHAIGFAGVVRPITPEQSRSEQDVAGQQTAAPVAGAGGGSTVSAPQLEDVRRTLEALRRAGEFMVQHSEDLQAPQIAKGGEAIRQQVSRISSVLDAISNGV